MEKRVSFYVSRKSLFTWLAALALLASAVLRIIYHINTDVSRGFVWLQIVLPVLGCILFVLILFLYGDEHFYWTAVPVWMLALYYAVKITTSGAGLRMVLLAWIAYLAAAFLYAQCVSGKLRINAGLFLMFLAALCVQVYIHRYRFQSGNFSALLHLLPDMLLMFAGAMTILAMGIHLDGKYHPTWGDRTDGRRVRTVDPLMTAVNYLMPTRTGAANHMEFEIEVSAIDRYVQEKRKEGLSGFGLMHVLLAAYVRCVARYPALNRFISGQQVYTRDDDIQFCLAVKTSMTIDAEESIAKVHLKPTDTVADVYRKLNREIEKIKHPEEMSDLDQVMKFLSYMPGLVYRLIVHLLFFLDYFGLLPAFLLEVSPFHASVFFTSMGSLGIPAITHHLYDFGNMSVFCAFGAKYHRYEPDAKGNMQFRKYISFSMNNDERIVDGFYYAQIYKYFMKLLAHPERLEQPPEEVRRDID